MRSRHPTTSKYTTRITYLGRDKPCNTKGVRLYAQAFFSLYFSHNLFPFKERLFASKSVRILWKPLTAFRVSEKHNETGSLRLTDITSGPLVMAHR